MYVLTNVGVTIHTDSLTPFPWIGHLKTSLMPLSGMLKITPRFHGHLKS